MLKKLTLLAMSVGALLAVVAPAAQATGPLVTNSIGEAAKTITGTSTNTVTHTSNGKLECATVNLHGEIETNANTTAKGKGTGTAKGRPGEATHGTHCRTSSGLLVTITSVVINSLHLTRHGIPLETTGTADFTYTYDLYTSQTALLAQCTFAGTGVPVKRTGTDTINITGNLIRVPHSSAFCPNEGTITGDFTVLDEFGSPVHIH